MANEQGGDVRELLLQIAKALVDEPEQVTVETSPGDDTTVLELRVAQKDLGKVIGKQGRTARSLRTILAAAVYPRNHRGKLARITAGVIISASIEPARFHHHRARCEDPGATW